jgi:hypothetical protein
LRFEFGHREAIGLDFCIIFMEKNPIFLSHLSIVQFYTLCGFMAVLLIWATWTVNRSKLKVQR